MQQFAVGIDLGGTMIKVALVERGKGLVQELAIETEADEGPAHVMDRIAMGVRQIQLGAQEKQILGVGIGAPAAVNWDRSAVLYPPNLPGWGIVDLRQELGTRLNGNLPVFVENDANLAGLGSAFYGAGRPFDSFIMVTLGTGVGGAIIYQNKIFRGSTGGAGELGHCSIDNEGPVDRYGIPGAIEAYLGQRFLSRYARYRLLTYDSIVHEWAGEDLINLTPLMLFEAAKLGDVHCQEILAWAGQKLAAVLGSAINLLDIRKVVVGGGVSAAGDFILEPTRKAVVHHVMPSIRSDVEIFQETLGNEVGMLGAAHLVFEFLDENSVSVGG